MHASDFQKSILRKMINNLLMSQFLLEFVYTMLIAGQKIQKLSI